MEITIGKQKQELNFGVRFVNELDNVIGVKRDGISLGFGLTKSIPALQAYDTAVLAQVLYCATFLIHHGQASNQSMTISIIQTLILKACSKK